MAEATNSYGSVAGPSQSASTTQKKPRTAQAWLEDIQQAEKAMSDYYERAKKIERIWLENRDDSKKFTRQYAMLWANVSVLQPAVYARQPQPVVTRRFSDRDPVARSVAEVMERSLVTLFDHGDLDTCLRSVRDNFLVVGRGSAWVRYEAKFEKQRFEFGDEAEEIDTLADETLAFDFVHWCDLVHPKARRWEDLPWLGRKVYPDKETLTARFGKEKADQVMFAFVAKNPGEYAKAKPKDKPCVFEVWSKRDKEVVWIAKDYAQDVLDRKPPLYNLHGFFPCPKPAYATLATDSLIPVPDYVYYQDQAEEINQLTAKIGALEDALKLVGFYAAGAEGGISSAIESALQAGTSNQMIPVPSWAAFAQGGGSKGLIEWLPIENVVLVLKSCVELRQSLINDVYQITGISDIIRGSTDPRETKGAQTLKAQWGSIRIQDRQAEMARFSRDMTRIAAEIVAEKFQPDTLWSLSGLQYPSMGEKQAIQAQMQQMQAVMQAMQQQAQQTAQAGQPPQSMPQMPPVPEDAQEALRKPSKEEIIDLMRNDRLRSYRIDIETDSTIAADEQAEKQSRIEFATMMSGFLQQAVPAVQQVPEMAPMLGEMLLFVTRAFRSGRQLEDTIEQFVAQIGQKAAGAGNQPPPPDPRMEKIKSDAALGEQKLKLQAQDSAAKNQLKQQEIMGDFRLGQQELAANVALERERIAAKSAQQMAQGFSINGGFPQ